ncbi:MAG TPA: hypothetical protein VF230_00325 [Acidimicrobiales bacterium]
MRNRTKRVAAIVVTMLVLLGLVVFAPSAGAWEKLACDDEPGFGRWPGHGDGSPVEIWYTNRDLAGGTDAIVSEAFEDAVAEWNQGVVPHVRMVPVDIEGDSFLPGSAKSDVDFDSVYEHPDRRAGWFTNYCDGEFLSPGNDIRLNQTWMDRYIAEGRMDLVISAANHETGHAFSLGHENDIPCDGRPNVPLMFETSCPPWIHPNEDDLAGPRAIYPLRPPSPCLDPTTRGPVDVGCI